MSPSLAQLFSPVTVIPAVRTHPDAERLLKGTNQTFGDLLLSGRTSICPYRTELPTDLEFVLHFGSF